MPEIDEDPTPAADEAEVLDTAGDGVVVGGLARVRRSDRQSLGIILVYLAGAVPLILLVLGRYRFFFSDEWNVIAGRDVSGFGELFRPNNAHWITLPSISYSILWHLVGLRSYLPYQAVLVMVHVAVVLLLRAVMRRADVGPWVATAAAASLVLFGPGADDITWAFQIGFTGSLAFGLVHLLLANVDGPVPWKRDALGLVAGLAALMCSGVGVVMFLAVAGAVLIRRGWRPALVHLVPLAATYALWVVLANPESSSPAGRPSASIVIDWGRSYVTGLFMAIGRYRPIAVLLALLTVGGLIVLVRSATRTELRRRLAGPVSLAVAAIAFSGSTAMARWQFGLGAARSGRYIYIGAALALPLIAVGADALRRRSPVFLGVALIALLIPIPGNATGFESPVYSRRYFARQREVIYYAPRVPFADQVPRDVRPIPDPFIIPEVNIGYLRDLQAAGKLRDDTSQVPPRILEEVRVRLGVAQRVLPATSTNCVTRTRPLKVRPRLGSVFVLDSPVSIRTVRGARIGALPVTLLPGNGRQLTIELPGLDLIVGPGFGIREFEWCDNG